MGEEGRYTPRLDAHTSRGAAGFDVKRRPCTCRTPPARHRLILGFFFLFPVCPQLLVYYMGRWGAAASGSMHVYSTSGAQHVTVITAPTMVR
jgi:hypothetical protein